MSTVRTPWSDINGLTPIIMLVYQCGEWKFVSDRCVYCSRLTFVVDPDDGHPGSRPRLPEAQQKRALYHTAHEERDKNSHYVTGLQQR